MNSFFDTLRRLGPAKLALLGAIAGGLIAFFGFFGSRLNQPAMSLLFSELSAQDSGQIVSKLEGQGIPYDIRANGTQIYVPSDRVLRLRMSFAEQGVPRGGTIGYEIFDRSEAIGATAFVQNLNQLRALEGELARTIGSLGPVAAARVHLVIPRRDLFSRERQEPTGSVVIRLREAGRLQKPQVLAVQHLVASSVPGLKPGRVSIIDDRGTLLARGQTDGEDSSATAANAEEMRRSYEQRVARTIEELIERSVGPGKVRAEVSAEMDFDRIVTNTESFDPDGQVVRSTQSVTETNDAQESSASSAVSVTANLPDGEGGGTQGRNASKSNRSEETVNYEISRTTKSHIRESGQVRRLSVAVLVDGATAAGADGKRTYTQRTPEEMERFTALAKSAVGFNQQRGDTIEVANLPFATIDESDIPTATSSMFDLGKQDYFRIAEILIIFVLGVLVLFLFLKPIATNIMSAPVMIPAPAGSGGTPLLPGATGPGPAALAAPHGDGPPQIAGAGGEPSPDAMIDLGRVEGRVKASSIKKIGEIVDKHPEEAVSIMRTWMYQDK